MRARKRNERTLQAKQEVIRVIGEYLTAKEKKPSVKMPLRRQSYMRKYKISSNTYYRVLKMNSVCLIWTTSSRQIGPTMDTLPQKIL